jgi:hypothetical protein
MNIIYADSVTNKLTDVMIDLYGDPQNFATAYAIDPDKVFQEVISKLKVVPITIKADLEATYDRHLAAGWGEPA